MNKKDIALTVGGVLATMVVAYLIYKMQQRDAAAQASAAQASSDAAAQAATEAQEADYSGGYQYAQMLSQVTSPTITGTTADTTAAVSSSVNTATTGATGTSIDSSDIDDLMSQIINQFAGSITTPPSSDTVASMTIPTLGNGSTNTTSSLLDIPTTAQAAAAQAASSVPAITTLYSTSAGYPVSMETGAAVSSHPVTAHPIVTTGN